MIRQNPRQGAICSGDPASIEFFFLNSTITKNRKTLKAIFAWGYKVSFAAFYLQHGGGLVISAREMVLEACITGVSWDDNISVRCDFSSHT